MLMFLHHQLVKRQKLYQQNKRFSCGIISLFIAGFILGIVAIVLSRKEDQKHRTAAMVLGIIDLLVGQFS